MKAATKWSPTVRTLAHCTLNSLASVGVQFAETRDREAIKLWRWYVEVATGHVSPARDEVIAAFNVVSREGIKACQRMVKGDAE